RPEDVVEDRRRRLRADVAGRRAGLGGGRQGEVGRAGRAAVVVGDGLDQLQARAVVVVVGRAGDCTADSERDRVALLGSAVAAPGAGGVAAVSLHGALPIYRPEDVVEDRRRRLRADVAGRRAGLGGGRQGEVGRAGRAAVVVGDGLDQLQARAVVV